MININPLVTAFQYAASQPFLSSSISSRNHIKRNSGFTLIEYIVVIIIIGILAVIALPNMFSNVTRSQGSTAIADMDGIKSSLETCSAQNNAVPSSNAGNSPCKTSSFGLTSTDGFTIDIYGGGSPVSQSATSGTLVVATGSPSGGNLTYSIIATDGAGNVLSITRATSGLYTCSAPNAGVYLNAC